MESTKSTYNNKNKSRNNIENQQQWQWKMKNNNILKIGGFQSETKAKLMLLFILTVWFFFLSQSRFLLCIPPLPVRQCVYTSFDKALYG